jgi:hypothetical protein
MTKLIYILTFAYVMGMLNPILLTAQLSISDPISVTDGDVSFGKSNPKLALNENGELMVFWMRTDNEAFFISTLVDGMFSTPNKISFEGLNPNLWSGSLGPNMASQGDHVYVTFEVYGEAIYVTHSSDAGLTWDAPVSAFVPPPGRRATIPTIAVDIDGQPYIAYVNTNASEQDAYYGMVRSLDFGQNFLNEVNVSENAAGVEACECCNGHISVASNGDVYVAFRNNNNNLRDNWLVRSTDGGTSFTSAFDVDETDWMIQACPSNGPHFSILDDMVITTFYSGAGSSGSGVYFSTFTPSTSEVGPTINLPFADNTFSTQNRPRVYGRGETLAVVWQEYTNNAWDIVMSVSTTGPEGLTDDPFLLKSLPSSQQFASVIYDGELFHVVYEDSETNTLLYQSVSFGSVNVKEVASANFRIQPNPSANFVEVIKESNESANIKIIDGYGRTLISDSISGKNSTLDISSLISGYYVIILLEDGAFSQRLLSVVK